MYVHVHVGMKIRRQCARIVFPSVGSWALNLGHQAWQQVPSPCHTGPALGFCVDFIFETKKHVARCPWTHCAAQASVRLPMLLPHLSSTRFQTCAATPVLEHSFLAVHWRKPAEASGSLLVLLERCINTWDYSAVWSGRVVIFSRLLLGVCVSPSGREELH